MSVAPKIMIQKTWDVTIVDFQEARLLEAQQIEAIGRELYRLVDEMDRKKIILDLTKVQFLASAAIGMLMSGSFITPGAHGERQFSPAGAIGAD